MDVTQSLILSPPLPPSIPFLFTLRNFLLNQMSVLTLNFSECTGVLGPSTPLSWALWIHVYVIKLKETDWECLLAQNSIKARVCLTIKYQQLQKVDFHLSSENAPTCRDWAKLSGGKMCVPPQLLLFPASVLLTSPHQSRHFNSSCCPQTHQFWL